MNEKNYLTINQIVTVTGYKRRNIERKIKKIKNDKQYSKLIINEKPVKIHKSLLPLIEPVYKKVNKEPKNNIINQYDWTLFCDFVPTDETSTEVLKAIMLDVFDFLKQKTKLPIKLFYSIEKQPKSDTHTHYFIQSNYDIEELTQLINERIELLCLSDQDIQGFMNDIKPYSTNYLLKGLGVNHKGAINLYSELITSGKRNS